VDLGRGRRYLNPGSWLMGTQFVCLEHGEVTMRPWNPELRAAVQVPGTRVQTGLQTIRRKPGAAP
jgi:hypothetical protein